MIAVADTGPLNYLVWIEEVDLLPRFSESVLIPSSVLQELQHSGTPVEVRSWVARLPKWLEVRPVGSNGGAELDHLGPGERDAITLAEEVSAEIVFLDDGDARKEAQRRGLSITGTLGILRRASQLEWIDLSEALYKLQQTTFYVRKELIASVLEEDARLKGGRS